VNNSGKSFVILISTRKPIVIHRFLWIILASNRLYRNQIFGKFLFQLLLSAISYFFPPLCYRCNTKS